MAMPCAKYDRRLMRIVHIGRVNLLADIPLRNLSALLDGVLIPWLKLVDDGRCDLQGFVAFLGYLAHLTLETYPRIAWELAGRVSNHPKIDVERLCLQIRHHNG